jgi:hypothetical protein
LNSNDLKPGTPVRFRGGSGRNDADEIYDGIVNGEPQVFKRERVTYIPVHLPRANHNVVVELENILDDND